MDKEDNYVVVEVGSGVYHFAALKSSGIDRN